MVSHVLTIEEYVSIAAGLPIPTEQQLQGFARYFCSAHSWYKLPLLRRVEPMFFFLDPDVAKGIQREDGRLRAVELEEAGFHYSSMPTAEYQERFGHLSYFRSSQEYVSLISEGGVGKIGADAAPWILDLENNRRRHLPREVLEVGLVRVGGVVHPLGAHESGLSRSLKAQPDLRWPEEAGGPPVLLEIRERCRELEKDPSCRQKIDSRDPRAVGNPSVSQVDARLYELLEPERARQRRKMVRAMKRVCLLVQPSASWE